MILELRCPNVWGVLLGKVIRDSDERVQSTIRIEIACASCRLALRRSGQPTKFVLHQFDVNGAVTNTKVVPA